MTVKVYNSDRHANVTEYRTDRITGIGNCCTREELEQIGEGKLTPMLNFVTKNGQYVSVPVELLIEITA